MLSLPQIFGFIGLALFFIIILVYGGYYLYISNFKWKKIEAKKGFSLRITVIIPTYNEKKTIGQKLENIIEQIYPKELMEIIVIDSNSQDKTLKIVRDFQRSHKELNMKIISERERKGKSSSINRAFASSSLDSEVFIMTDADSLLEKDAIDNVINCFQNPEIGAVCGTQMILNVDESGETRLEGTYRSFYKKLRTGESMLDSTPIFDGELAAYRADIVRSMKVRENSNADDCQLAVLVRKSGYRAISCPDAVFYEYAPSDWRSVKIQKVRRGQGLSRNFWYNRDLMFNKNYGKFGSFIFPVNFFMHIISPFTVLMVIAFESIFVLDYLLKNLSLFVPLMLALFPIFLLRHFLLKVQIIDIGWTFISYQFLLLEGMILALMGRSLYKWQKVDSIRDKFSNNDKENFSGK